MAITKDDFGKVWASTSPLTPYAFSDAQYKEGWNFIGSTPPSRQMWDFLQKNNDEKMQYLLNHFDNYLPLSGGTINGDLSFTGGSRKINFSSGFQINAGDGTTQRRMIGKPDGTLTWDGKEVERVSAKGTYGIRFESGIQICWGTLSIPAGTADRDVSGTMTFPYPFANTNYVLTFGNDWRGASSEFYRAEGRNTANFKFTAVAVRTNDHKAFYVAIGYWK